MNKLDTLKEYLAKSPDDNFLRHAMALEYIKLGNDTEARTLFEDILNRDPGYTGSYYHLGKLLEKMERPEEAIEWYERGMVACQAAGDRHAFGELRGAYEELTF